MNKPDTQHNCPDGVTYKFKRRVENPKECPRCKQRKPALIKLKKGGTK